MYLKITCFFLILLFLIGCATSETTLNSPYSAYVEERDYCYSSSLVTTWNPYRVSEVSNKKYLTEGAFPGRHTFFTESGYTKAKEKMKNCLKEKSNNLCKRVHKSKAINSNWQNSNKWWSNGIVNFNVLALSFDCGLSSKEKNNEIKKEKIQIQELENLYQEACLSSYNKLKKSNERKYSLNSPLYIDYRICLMDQNKKLRYEIDSIYYDMKSLDQRARSQVGWSPYVCQKEPKHISTIFLKVYNKLYLECSRNVYELAKQKHRSILESDNKNIIKQFPKSKKYCEKKNDSLIGKWRCYKNIVREEKSIAELEDYFLWEDWQCTAKNIFSQDRYKVYHNCLKSLKFQEEEDKAIERAKKATEKKDREKAERELAKIEPYKKKCESFGFKRKSTQMGMCILQLQELEAQALILHKQSVAAEKEIAKLNQEIQELRATNNAILEEQKKQNYLASRQIQIQTKTQALTRRNLRISEFQENMRLMRLGLGLMGSNQPVTVTCGPYLLNMISCTQ